MPDPQRCNIEAGLLPPAYRVIHHFSVSTTAVVEMQNQEPTVLRPFLVDVVGATIAGLAMLWQILTIFMGQKFSHVRLNYNPQGIYAGPYMVMSVIGYMMKVSILQTADSCPNCQLTQAQDEAESTAETIRDCVSFWLLFALLSLAHHAIKLSRDNICLALVTSEQHELAQQWDESLWISKTDRAVSSCRTGSRNGEKGTANDLHAIQHAGCS